MIKYLDKILHKVGLVRIALASSVASNIHKTIEKQMRITLTAHETEIANLNARIHELKRCNAGNAVGMYG